MNDSLKILLVEDNPGDARLIRIALSEAGKAPRFELTLVEGLAQSFDALLADVPDLILLDINLPDSHGIDTVTRMVEKAHNAPIIILTGLEDETLSIQALRLGAQDYLVKGQLDSNLLSRSIRYAIERKQAEEALRVSEDRYRDLVENSQDLLCTHDLDGKLLSVNEAAIRLSGYPRETLLHMNLADLLVPDGRPLFGEYLKLIQATGHAGGLMRIQTASGETRYWEYDNTLRTKGVTSPIVRGLARDITERKRAEESLRLQSAALDAAANAIVITNREGVIEWINLAFTTLTGYSAKEAIGKNPRDLVKSGKQNQALYKQLWNTVLAGKVWRGELINRRKDGSLYIEEQTITPLQNADGSVSRFIAIKQDISQRKQAEINLRDAEARYRVLFEQSPYGVVLIDIETGKTIEANDIAHAQLGYTREEFAVLRISDYEAAENLEETANRMRKIIRDGSDNFETLHRTKSGEIRNVHVSVKTLPLSDTQLFYAIFQDITESKQAEAQIYRQLKRLNTLRVIDTAIASSFDIRITLNIILQQIISELSVDAAAILLVYLQEQSMEYKASQGFHSNVLHHTRLHVNEGYAGRAVSERQTIHIPDLQESDGKLAEALQQTNEKFVSYYGVPLIVKGEVKGVLEIFHRSALHPDAQWLDFLETLSGQVAIAIDNAQLFEGMHRANAELEQRVAERTTELNQTNIKLEHANHAKDEFLATMSHELRTPLNSILGLSESLLEQMRDPLSDHQKNSLQIIGSSGIHLLALINDILDLSKIEAGKFDYYPQSIDIDEVCRSSLAFVKEAALKKSITVTHTQELTVSKIYADPRRLKQILVNLLSNAVKFTPNQGHVILEVHAETEQDRLQFSVRDTGIGIAPEDLKKLFQPFVQVDSRLTREHDGTGLGLALAQKLADLQGGSVEVASEVGKGSLFTVHLPLGQAMIAQQQAIESGSKPLNDDKVEKKDLPAQVTVDHGLILLAEDNMTNVLVIGDYLEAHGYQIVVAHDGLEALQKAEEQKPDLILMDIQMPVLDGLETIHRLRNDSRFTATPIIALTALAMSGDRERCLEAGANEYISKPVSLNLLLKSIRDFLRT